LLQNGEDTPNRGTAKIGGRCSNEEFFERAAMWFAPLPRRRQ
jgi:hypothetical protein